MYISSCAGFLNCTVTVRNLIMASLNGKILRLEERMDLLMRLDRGQSYRSVVIMCSCEKQQIAQVCQE